MGTPTETNDISLNSLDNLNAALSTLSDANLFSPLSVSHKKRIRCFQRGWSHVYQGVGCAGYYVGTDHFPFTEVRLVKSVEKVGDFFFLVKYHSQPHLQSHITLAKHASHHTIARSHTQTNKQIEHTKNETHKNEHNTNTFFSRTQITSKIAVKERQDILFAKEIIC